jgi:hypothetical protein
LSSLLVIAILCAITIRRSVWSVITTSLGTDLTSDGGALTSGSDGHNVPLALNARRLDRLRDLFGYFASDRSPQPGLMPGT